MQKTIYAKSLSVLTALMIVAITMMPGASKASVDDSVGDNIKCPEGDDYKCYTFDNGGVVYKGKGGVIATPTE